MSLFELLKMPTVRTSKPTTASGLGAITPIETIVRRPIRIDEPITFGASGNAKLYQFGNDWHNAELDFTWTSHSVARLAFNALFSAPVTLQMELQLMSERPWRDLGFAATLNGRLLNIESGKRRPSVLRARVGDCLRPAHETNILVLHSEPIRVSDLIGGHDERVIGAGLRKVCFFADVPANDGAGPPMRASPRDRGAAEDAGPTGERVDG